MSERMEFMAYCIEEYKAAEHLSGKTVIDLFDKYGVLGYIADYFDALHTTGGEYIIKDINGFIDNRKAAT